MLATQCQRSPKVEAVGLEMVMNLREMERELKQWTDWKL